MNAEQPTILDALQACYSALDDRVEEWERLGNRTARLDALWAVVPSLVALLEQTIRSYDEKMSAVAEIVTDLGRRIDAPAPAPGDTP